MDWRLLVKQEAPEEQLDDFIGGQQGVVVKLEPLENQQGVALWPQMPVGPIVPIAPQGIEVPYDPPRLHGLYPGYYDQIGAYGPFGRPERPRWHQGLQEPQQSFQRPSAPGPSTQRRHQRDVVQSLHDKIGELNVQLKESGCVIHELTEKMDALQDEKRELREKLDFHQVKASFYRTCYADKVKKE